MALVGVEVVTKVHVTKVLLRLHFPHLPCEEKHSRPKVNTGGNSQHTVYTYDVTMCYQQDQTNGGLLCSCLAVI